MRGFWKRTGWLMISILPFISSIVLQLLLGIVCMFPFSLAAGLEAAQQGITDGLQIESYIQEAVYASAPYALLAYHLASIPVYGIWYYFGCGRKKAGNPLKIIPLKRLPWLLLCGLGLSLLSYGLTGMLQYITPGLVEQYSQLMEAAGIGLSFITIIATLFLAPIGEELLCRGITLHYAMKVTQGMKNRKGAFWIANFIQALLFGIMHLNFVQGLYAFFIGLILGGLTYSYKSIYPAIFVHFTVNLLGSLVMPHIMDKLPEHAAVWIIVLFVGILITASALWQKNHKISEET